MRTQFEAIEAQALRLSSGDRARLLDRLILSLDEDKAQDAVWDAVAAQRDAEIEAGQVAELDGPSVVAALRVKYG